MTLTSYLYSFRLTWQRSRGYTNAYNGLEELNGSPDSHSYLIQEEEKIIIIIIMGPSANESLNLVNEEDVVRKLFKGGLISRRIVSLLWSLYPSVSSSILAGK